MDENNEQTQENLEDSLANGAPGRKRKWPFVLLIVVPLLVFGAVSYTQGWMWMDRLPGAGQSGDISKIDGFEAEIDESVALLTGGDTKKATAILEDILDKAPNHVLANYNMGVIAQSDGRLDDAISHYTTTLIGAPNFWNALYNRGLAMRDVGNADQAIADLSTVVVNNPNWAAASFNLGNLLVEQGDTAKGNAFLARAKKLDPTLGN